MHSRTRSVHDRRHRTGVESILALTRRLFAGIELSEPVRAVCADAAERLRHTGFAARYDDPAKYHVTLAFLGNVASERIDEVSAALETVAPIEPFELTFDKLGAFPHERRPRIVYAGARSQGPEFRALATVVRDAYRARGFDFKEDSVAHVTIARVKDTARPLPWIDVPEVALAVREVALFESLPDKINNTSRYEVLLRAKLRA